MGNGWKRDLALTVHGRMTATQLCTERSRPPSAALTHLHLPSPALTWSDTWHSTNSSHNQACARTWHRCPGLTRADVVGHAALHQAEAWVGHHHIHGVHGTGHHAGRSQPERRQGQGLSGAGIWHELEPTHECRLQCSRGPTDSWSRPAALTLRRRAARGPSAATGPQSWGCAGRLRGRREGGVWS